MIKNFHCSLCDYRASKNVQLKAHVDSVHLKKKRYKCSMCDFATNQKSYLEVHLNSVHSEKQR